MQAGTAAIKSTLRTYVALPAAVQILCFGSFINRAGSFAMVFMTIYVSEQLGFGVTFAANCFGVFGLGSVISSIVGGQLADRFGRKPIMLLALFGGAAALCLMGMARERWSFLTAVLVFSLAMEMYRPAASAMIGDLVDTAQRPLAFSLMYIAFNLGFSVAAPVGGFLADYSYQWLFWGDALTTATYGLIVVFCIRETLPATAESNSTNAGVDRVSWRAALKHIRHDTTFLLLAAAAMLTSLVFMQAFSTLPIYISQLGYTKQEVGLLISANGILIVFLQLPVTHVLNRYHRVLVILTGEILIAVGFVLTAFAVTAPLLLTTIIIWTLGEVVQAAFKQSLVADLAPVALRARYMGVFSLSHALGFAIGAPLGGQILSRWGPTVLWPICFVITMIAAGVYWLIHVRIAHLLVIDEDSALEADLAN